MIWRNSRDFFIDIQSTGDRFIHYLNKDNSLLARNVYLWIPSSLYSKTLTETSLKYAQYMRESLAILGDLYELSNLDEKFR